MIVAARASTTASTSDPLQSPLSLVISLDFEAKARQRVGYPNKTDQSAVDDVLSPRTLLCRCEPNTAIDHARDNQQSAEVNMDCRDQGALACPLIYVVVSYAEKWL